MSLIIATGSNMGDRYQHLDSAKNALKKKFQLISESQIYHSPAVDHLDQPDFYNQVLEFVLPQSSSADEVMTSLLELEEQLGRVRNIPKGPRIIDLDILFWGIESIQSKNVTVPHPRLFERSFVVLPLKELPYFAELKKHFNFPEVFPNKAQPIAP